MLFPLALALRLSAEPKRAPWEIAKRITVAAPGFWSRDLLVGILWRRARPAAAETKAKGTPSSVVLATARRVRERVIGVVDLLELAGAGGSLGRVGGHAVRVVFQRCSLVGVADLFVGCCRGDVERGVVVYERVCWIALVGAGELWKGLTTGHYEESQSV